MQTSSVGLVLHSAIRGDGFVTALVHALAQPLIEADMKLLTAVVEDHHAEERTYERWAQVGGVSAVVLLGGTPGDERISRLRSLGFVVVAVVDTAIALDVPAVVVDFEASISVLRNYLAARELPRAIYVSEADGRGMLPLRDAAIFAAGVEPVPILRVDSGDDSAVAAALSALESGPASLIFESDLDAAAAFTAARARGLRIPEDVAIISWSSSIVCQSTSMSITAINRRGAEIGGLLGALTLEAIAGEAPIAVRAPEPFVVVGETT